MAVKWPRCLRLMLMYLAACGGPKNSMSGLSLQGGIFMLVLSGGLLRQLEHLSTSENINCDPSGRGHKKARNH